MLLKNRSAWTTLALITTLANSALAPDAHAKAAPLVGVLQTRPATPPVGRHIVKNGKLKGVPAKAAAKSSASAAVTPLATSTEFPYGYTTVLDPMQPALSQVYQASGDSHMIATVDSDGTDAVFYYVNDYVGYVSPKTGNFLYCDYLHPKGQFPILDVIDCYPNGNVDDLAYTSYYDTGELLKSGSTLYYRDGHTLRSGSYWYYDNANYLYAGGSSWYYPNGNYFTTGGSSFYYPASSGNYLRSGTSMYYSNGNSLRYNGNLYFSDGNYLRYGTSEYRYPGSAQNVAGLYNFSSGYANLFYSNVSQSYLKHDTSPYSGPVYYVNGAEAPSYVEYSVAIPAYGSVTSGSVSIDAQYDRDILSYTMYDGSATHVVYVARKAPEVPAAPVNVLVNPIGTTSASMSWNAGSGATPSGYIVRFVAGASSSLACSGGTDLGNVLGTTLSSLSPATAYSYALCAYNSIGALGLPARGSFTTRALPNPPTGATKISSDFRTLTIGWNSGGGTTNDYIVAFAKGTSAPACSTGTVVTSPQVTTASTLDDDSDYAFGICARSSDGALSPQLNFVARTAVKPIPPKPTGLAVSLKTDSGFRVSWVSGGGNTAGFKLAYVAGSVSTVDCAAGNSVDLGASVTQRDLSGLADNAATTVGICSVNQYGHLSAPVLVTGTTNKIPSVTGFVQSNVRPTSFLLSWTSGGGSTNGYGVKISAGVVGSPACTGLTDNLASTSKAFGNLTDGQRYTYVVCARNALGHYSDPAVGTVDTPVAIPPNSPTGLTKVSADFRSATVRWTNGGGTTEYFRIAYALGTSVPNCQSGTEVPASTTQFTTPNTLADSSDYTFSVCARYENKFSAAISTLVHTEAKPIPPKAVNLVANVVHDSRIDLSWASGGATTVQFRVGAVAGTSAPAACTVPGSVVVPLSQLSNSFHPLLPDTSYALVVCAINEYGFESAPSFVVAKTPVLTKPPQVSNLVLDSFGDTEAALSWASGGGNTASYKVGYKQGSFATLDCSNATQAQDATSYSVNNLLKDYDYTFVVCALSESGALSDPGILHVHTISPSPAPLNFQSAVVSDSVVRFSWEPGNNVTQSYRIVSKVGKVAPACSGGVALKEPVRSYEWHKLKPGTQYSFSLCAYNVAKIASRPLSVTLTTQALTPPLPLDSFGVQSSTDSSVKLAWTVKAPNGGNLAQFRIVAKAGTVAPACNSGGVLLDKSIRSYEFRALKGVYSFTICGLSEIGTLSVKSDTSVQLAAAYAPPAPTDLHVTSLNDTVVKLAWTSGGDNTVKFRLVNKVGAIAPSCASGGTLLDDEILSYSYPTLKPSTQYTFALCALNGTSPVKISTARTLTVNTLAAAAPPKPQGFAVSRKSDTVIALSWNPVAASGDNTTKFRIVSKAGSVAPSCASGGTLVEETVTSTQFAGLKPGAPYSFTLCGLNGTNLVSPKSDLTESTDALTVPNAPTLPEFDDEASDALSLQWSWKSGLSNTLGYYVAFAAGDLPSLDCRAGSEASVLEVAHPASERVIYRKTTGLAANRAYTISVCAYSASKQVSAPVVIRGGKTQRPPAVDLLQIYGAPTRTSIGIQWVSGGIGTSNYLVSISLGDVAPECGAGGVANVQSTPTYLSKTGLKAGTQYAVSVCGRAANGELSDKESLLIKTDP